MIYGASFVYLFNCSECHSTYVGQSGQHLCFRVCEHLGLSPFIEQLIKTNSSIFEHIYNTGHKAILILRSASSKFDLPLLEHLSIRKLKPDLNYQNGCIKMYFL